MDVSDREAVYKAAKEWDNSVDILINNAGVLNSKKFLNTPDEKIDKLVDVNLLAQFWVLILNRVN